MLLIVGGIKVGDPKEYRGKRMKDYKYQYIVVVTTAKKMDDFNQYKEVIFECRDIYNKKSAHSRNPKKIEKITIYKESLEIELNSVNKLNTPLKALWQFSTSLVQKKVLGKYINGSRLFVPLLVKEVSDNGERAFISNQEIVKKVIEIFIDDSSEKEIQKINEEFRKEIRYIIEQYELRKASMKTEKELNKNNRHQ